MSVIQQISSIVRTQSVDGTTVTLRQADFAGIPVMNAFFDKVVGGPELVITGATVLPEEPSDRWLAITGTSDCLGAQGLATLLTFFGPDADVVIRLQGDYPPGAPYVLPVVDWLALYSRRVVARLTGRFEIVELHYEGQAGAYAPASSEDPRLRLRLHKLGRAYWRMIAGGRDGAPLSMAQIVQRLRDARPDELTLDELLALLDGVGPAGIPLTVDQLVALLGGEALTDFLPASLVAVLAGTAFDGLAAEVVNVSPSQLPPVRPAEPPAEYPISRIPYFSIGVSAVNGWDVLPGAVVIKPGLAFTLTLIDGGAQTIGQVTGTFALGVVDVPAFLQATLGGFWVVGIQPTKSVVLPSLSDLLALAGGPTFLATLPPGFATIPGIVLDRLAISFNPTEAVIGRIDFAMYTASIWQVIPGYFTVTSFRAAMDIRAVSSGSPVAAIDLLGVFEIGGTPVQCRLTTPQGSADWTFACGLPPEGTLDLTAVAAKLLPGEVIPSNAPDLVFTTLEMSATPATSTLSFKAGSTTPWQITQSFAIHRFALDFVYVAGTIAGTIAGTLGIAGVTLELAADLDDTPDGGWHFAGKATGQSIPIGALAAGIAEKFGVTAAVPRPIETLVVTDVEVSFATKTMDFTFACRTTMTVGQSQAAMVVDIDLRRGSDGLYQKRFGGRMTLGTYDFALVFSRAAVATTFLAVYHDGSGQPMNVTDLVESFSGVSGLPPMTFGVYQASFAYHATAGGAGVYLFAFDMEAGINLSNLPLIGQMLPPDTTVRLIYQVLFASGTVRPAEIGAINALMPAPYTLLPVKAGGLSGSALLLSTKIRLGDAVANLDLPVQIGPDGQLQTTSSGASPARAGAGGGSDITWVALEKQYGPVYFSRIGGYVDGGDITFLLDAGLSLPGLSIALDGLSVTSPLTTFQPTFGLLGLSIAFRKGALSIDGGFLRSQGVQSGVPYDVYSGQARIALPKIQVAALGSYARLNGAPSLFIYGVLDAPLGGAPFFFVEGLAAGFGYNRAFIAPGVAEVATFPLVTAARNGVRSITPADVTAMLAALQTSVPPTVGASFLSLGVRWNTFRLVDAFAMVTVQTGERVELNLLGLGRAVIPQGAAPASALCVAELALAARFSPDEGVVAVQGQLTPASYILSNNCRITGGFAASAWFSGASAGDFVLTLGGYHPSYVPPAHYPIVPRLGFTWRIDSALVFKGTLYCALTPSVLMAGGSLEASYESGGLRVSFVAKADFLIGWKPYHYSADVRVNVTGSYTYTFFGQRTLSVNVGADLKLWGPALSGQLEIKLSVATLTIRFGNASPAPPPPIGWSTFQSSFLPAAAQVVTASVAAGMVSGGGGGEDMGVVDPSALRVRTGTAFPAEKASVGTDVWTASGKPFGVRPMGIPRTQIRSVHRVSIAGPDGPAESQFDYDPIVASMPKALWGAPVDPKTLLGEKPTVESGLLVGVEIRPRVATSTAPTATIPVACLDLPLTPVTAAVRGVSIASAAGAEGDRRRRETMATTIMAPSVVEARRELLSAFGVEAPEIDLAPSVVEAFREAPWIPAKAEGTALAPAGEARARAGVWPDAALAAPAAVAVDVVMDGLRITWLSVPGAVDYHVRLTPRAAPPPTAPTVTVEGTSAFTSALPRGSAWTVQVRGHAEPILGPWSEPVEAIIVSGVVQPPGLVLRNTPHAVVAAWKKVRGAIAYDVAFRDDRGALLAAYRVPGLSASLPAGGLEDGRTVRVFVEAVLAETEGVAIDRLTLAAPKDLDVRFDAGERTIVARWSAVPSATGYEVWLFDVSGLVVRPPSPAATTTNEATLDASTFPVDAVYYVGVCATAPRSVGDPTPMAKVVILPPTARR